MVKGADWPTCWVKVTVSWDKVTHYLQLTRTVFNVGLQSNPNNRTLKQNRILYS